MVEVGSEVRIRGVRVSGTRLAPPNGIHVNGEDNRELLISIVPPGDMGLHRVTSRMPLGKALLGHRVGEVVSVCVKAGTLEYEILSVRSATATAGAAHGQ